MVPKLYMSIKKLVSNRVIEVSSVHGMCLQRNTGAVKVLEMLLMPTQEDHHVPILEGHESCKKDIPEYT